MPAFRQQDITLEDLNQQIWQYLEERDWHNNSSKNLAISLSLEANELLKHYQWSDNPVGSMEDIGDELADVLLYSFQIAQQNNIDIATHIKKKLEKVTKKYPAKSFKNVDTEIQKAAWIRHKLNHNKESL